MLDVAEEVPNGPSVNKLIEISAKNKIAFLKKITKEIYSSLMYALIKMV
jgi:hypothetical protein